MMGEQRDRWAGVETLYELVTPGAIKMAYLITGDHAAAEDVVHDAFIKVVNKHQNLADVAGVRAYLRTAVVNEIRMARRSWLSRMRRQERYVRGESDFAESAHDVVLERDELVAALSTLSLTQRTVLVLTYLVDLSDHDISATTGLARGTIKSARHRGLAALRKELGRDSAEIW